MLCLNIIIIWIIGTFPFVYSILRSVKATVLAYPKAVRNSKDFFYSLANADFLPACWRSRQTADWIFLCATCIPAIRFRWNRLPAIYSQFFMFLPSSYFFCIFFAEFTGTVVFMPQFSQVNVTPCLFPSAPQDEHINPVPLELISVSSMEWIRHLYASRSLM